MNIEEQYPVFAIPLYKKVVSPALTIDPILTPGLNTIQSEVRNDMIWTLASKITNAVQRYHYGKDWPFEEYLARRIHILDNRLEKMGFEEIRQLYVLDQEFIEDYVLEHIEELTGPLPYKNV